VVVFLFVGYELAACIVGFLSQCYNWIILYVNSICDASDVHVVELPYC